MQYSHQAQLSELTDLPRDGDSVRFFTAGVLHTVQARDDSTWSLLESSGSLLGEFVADAGGFAVLSDDGPDSDHFDNWRSAVRHILRRGALAA